jgi:hypothetical protein
MRMKANELARIGLLDTVKGAKAAHRHATGCSAGATGRSAPILSKDGFKHVGAARFALLCNDHIQNFNIQGYIAQGERGYQLI